MVVFFVVVFLWWCFFVVFFWWCFCGAVFFFLCGGVVVFVRLWFCDGGFVVVF